MYTQKHIKYGQNEQCTYSKCVHNIVAVSTNESIVIIINNNDNNNNFMLQILRCSQRKASQTWAQLPYLWVASYESSYVIYHFCSSFLTYYVCVLKKQRTSMQDSLPAFLRNERHLKQYLFFLSLSPHTKVGMRCTFVHLSL